LGRDIADGDPAVTPIADRFTYADRRVHVVDAIAELFPNVPLRWSLEETLRRPTRRTPP
jgi:hypothetical protein